MSRKSYPQPPLTGPALLAKLETLTELNKTGKAKACGYVNQLKSGKERVHFREFMNALIEAQGIQLDGQRSEKRGRALSYRVTVQKNGILIIGAGYTQEMGLNPGDRIEIKLGRESLKLTVLESGDDFEETIHDDDEFDSDEIA